MSAPESDEISMKEESDMIKPIQITTNQEYAIHAMNMGMEVYIFDKSFDLVPFEPLITPIYGDEYVVTNTVSYCFGCYSVPNHKVVARKKIHRMYFIVHPSTTIDEMFIRIPQARVICRIHHLS
jgi:hypothetical protein